MAARRIPNPKAGGSNPSGVRSTPQGDNFLLLHFISIYEHTTRGLAFKGVPVAQLDKASDYESEDWGFESLQG